MGALKLGLQHEDGFLENSHTNAQTYDHTSTLQFHWGGCFKSNQLSSSHETLKIWRRGIHIKNESRHDSNSRLSFNTTLLNSLKAYSQNGTDGKVIAHTFPAASAATRPSSIDPLRLRSPVMRTFFCVDMAALSAPFAYPLMITLLQPSCDPAGIGAEQETPCLTSPSTVLSLSQTQAR